MSITNSPKTVDLDALADELAPWSSWCEVSDGWLKVELEVTTLLIYVDGTVCEKDGTVLDTVLQIIRKHVEAV